MDNLLKWLLAAAPFLAPYPPWVKSVFALWVGLGSVLVVALILARPATTASPSADQPPPTKPPISKQNELWMVTDGLEFFAANEGAQVRVVANVNGTEFTYPSKAGVEWLEVGPSMSPQVFHLPPAADRYIVRFDATVRVPGRAQGKPWITGQLKSVNEHVVNVSTDIPFSGRYVLHTFDPVHRARSASAEAQLLYRITADPK